MKKANTNHNRLNFPAEVFDKIQYFFQEYNDHQVRAVIYFEGLTNRVLIEKALHCSIDIVPILRCRFVLDKVQPFWEQADESCLYNLFSFLEIEDTDTEDEIQRFITGKTDEKTGPQIMARIIRASGKDILCIVMNHKVCDGAGFKEYLYLLGEIYTRLQDGTYKDFRYHNGNRSEQQIYGNFTFTKKLKAFFLPRESVKKKNTVCFPLGSKRVGQTPFILRYKLSPERFERLKKYGKSHTVTINDIVLAAYFRALNRMLCKEQSEALTIPCMVDLRRYLHGKKADGICNLTAMISCRIGTTDGEGFDETVSRVSTAMNRRKSDYPGLNGLSTLKILYALPFRQAYQILKKKYANPMIGMTNIGIINPDKLIYGKEQIKDAYVAASVKYPPYFQLGLTTYNNSITFTVNEYCLESDKAIIQRFFSLLDQELSL